jgi:hypothetical protein
MEKTRLIRKAATTTAALAFVAILGANFALAPLTMASSPGSDYPIELIRAHTDYVTVRVDLPAPPISQAAAIPSPDMKLIRMSDGQSGAALQALLLAADDL